MSPRIPSLAVQREDRRSNRRVLAVLLIEDARAALYDGNADLARAYMEQLHRDAVAVLDDDECAAVARLRTKGAA